MWFGLNVLSKLLCEWKEELYCQFRLCLVGCLKWPWWVITHGGKLFHCLLDEEGRFVGKCSRKFWLVRRFWWIFWLVCEGTLKIRAGFVIRYTFSISLLIGICRYKWGGTYCHIQPLPSQYKKMRLNHSSFCYSVAQALPVRQNSRIVLQHTVYHVPNFDLR